jgi:hypothetical protein
MAAKNPFPPHISQFLENIAEVEKLLDIHAQLGGAGPGRKRDVEVLNKSAIVLVVACWEALVEDLASLALDFMIDNAKDYKAFPPSVLDRVGSKYSGPNAWTLAGDGWKKALRDSYTEILAKTTGILNTPRAPQVDDLFQKSVGLKSVSACWYWKGRSKAKAIAALDDLVTLRGSIAHRVTSSKYVYKKDVSAAIKLASYLAAKTSNSVRTHVHSSIGKHPWGAIKYGGIG